MKMRILTLIVSFAILLSSCTQNNVNESKSTDMQDSTSLSANDKDTLQIDASDSTADEITLQTDSDPRIAEIQNAFRRINTGNLKSEKIDFECDAKGSITYFTENGDVSKIILDWGFVGDGSLVSEFYFTNDKLIFVYDVIIAMPPGQETFRKERRSYVENDKVIKYIEDNKTQKCETCSFDSNARAYKVLRAYESKDYMGAVCK